jgi:hypothetical protein
MPTAWDRGSLAMHNSRELGNGDFVVAYTLVEIGEQGCSFRGNHGGVPVGSGEGVDGGESCQYVVTKISTLPGIGRVQTAAPRNPSGRCNSGRTDCSKWRR